MKMLAKIVFFFVASLLYSLSVGIEGSFFFPEGGLPAMEFSLSQDVKLPYGFFLRGTGIYYRLFGIGVTENNHLWSMFSGDMIGDLAFTGMQYQQKKWHIAFAFGGGWGKLFSLELREHVARDYLRTLEGSDPLVVSTDLSQTDLFGWGVSTEIRHQWKQLSLGLLVGWLHFEGKETIHLYWSERANGFLQEKHKNQEIHFLLRGMQIGISFRILL